MQEVRTSVKAGLHRTDLSPEYLRSDAGQDDADRDMYVLEKFVGQRWARTCLLPRARTP